MDTSTAPLPTASPIGEAAELLHCSRSHVYNLINAGLIRTVKIGHRTLVPTSEIRRALEVGTGPIPR